MRKIEYVKDLVGITLFLFLACSCDWWVEIVLGVLGL